MHKREPVVTYVSSLAGSLHKFVSEKRALGYRYDSGESTLQQFDRLLLVHNVHTPDIPKSVMNTWVAKRIYEHPRNQHRRVSVVRQFCKFLERQGFRPDTPPRISARRQSSAFIPYIFTREQIRSLLSAADHIPPSFRSPNRETMFPLILRILYGCGLRVSEVLGLRVEDVNLTDGVLTIREAKLDNQRLVPVAESILVHMRKYAVIRLKSKTTGEFFFSAPDGGRFHKRTIYDVFRKLLRECGIGHGGSGKGPRLHDLRHTFACHRLAQWFRDGVDPGIALPVLSAYLGHGSIYETQHYLRMIPELYPDITKALVANLGDIIPERSH